MQVGQDFACVEPVGDDLHRLRFGASGAEIFEAGLDGAAGEGVGVHAVDGGIGRGGGGERGVADAEIGEGVRADGGAVFDDGERGALDGGDGGVVIGVDRVVRLSGFDETDADQRSQDDENREKHNQSYCSFFHDKRPFRFFSFIISNFGRFAMGISRHRPLQMLWRVKQKGSVSIRKRSLLWVNP